MRQGLRDMERILPDDRNRDAFAYHAPEARKSGKPVFERRGADREPARKPDTTI